MAVALRFQGRWWQVAEEGNNYKKEEKEKGGKLTMEVIVGGWCGRLTMLSYFKLLDTESAARESSSSPCNRRILMSFSHKMSSWRRFKGIYGDARCKTWRN